MKRRGFFGLMGGAAVAGPAMAKQAIQTLPVGLDPAIGQAVAGNLSAQGVASGPDKASRILQLQRLISGNLSDEEREERKRQKLYQRHQLISQEVASLRSVSGVRKLDMYQDRVQRVSDEISKSHNMTYLERLLSGKEEYGGW